MLKQSLDIIFSSSKDDGDCMYAECEVVYYSVRYMNPRAKFKLKNRQRTIIMHDLKWICFIYLFIT